MSDRMMLNCSCMFITFYIIEVVGKTRLISTFPDLQHDTAIVSLI